MNLGDKILLEAGAHQIHGVKLLWKYSAIVNKSTRALQTKFPAQFCNRSTMVKGCFFSYKLSRCNKSTFTGGKQEGWKLLTF